MENQNGYNVQRAHKVNLWVILVGVSLLCLQVIVSKGWEGALKVTICTGVLFTFTLANYFLLKNQTLKSLFFAVIPEIAAFGLMAADGYTLNKHYLIFSTIAMVTLYFKKELIVLFGITVNIGYIVMYIFLPHNLLSDNILFKEFITVITLLNSILCLLYFLTKWGNELVEKASNKEKEANELLAKLKHTFDTIDDGAVNLYSNISTVDTELSGVTEASKGIVESVQQMATAISEEASSVYRINEAMTESLQVVKETVHISKSVAKKSDDMSKKVEEGWEKIRQVTGEMKIITQTIGTTSTTVQELKTSLLEITSLLNNIKAIAGQTNLLALNASIESARAGEAGKGFAVVAENIRTLSEQSKKIVESINDVTSAILEKSENASLMSLEGEAAANNGMVIIEQVAAYFREIKDTCMETNDEMSMSMNEITKASNNFISVQEQISNVASISEENSASTEEILSIIEDENSKIAYINKSVSQVYELSKKLKDMVNAV